MSIGIRNTEGAKVTFQGIYIDFTLKQWALMNPIMVRNRQQEIVFQLS